MLGMYVCGRVFKYLHTHKIEAIASMAGRIIARGLTLTSAGSPQAAPVPVVGWTDAGPGGRVMMADRGEGVNLSSCRQTARNPVERHQPRGGDGGIIKATLCKDVRMGKAKSWLEKWLPGAGMTHPEKRKSLSWTARGGDQSQTVYGKNCLPVFWLEASNRSLLHYDS